MEAYSRQEEGYLCCYSHRRWLACQRRGRNYDSCVGLDLLTTVIRLFGQSECLKEFCYLRMTRKNLGAHPEFPPGTGRELALKDKFKGAPPIKLNLHSAVILRIKLVS